MWQVENNMLTCERPIRYRLDGQRPTAADGHYLRQGDYVILSKDAIENLRVYVVGDNE